MFVRAPSPRFPWTVTTDHVRVCALQVPVDRVVERDIVREVPVDRMVEVPVDRVVEVPVDRVIERDIVREVPVDRLVKVPVDRVIQRAPPEVVHVPNPDAVLLPYQGEVVRASMPNQYPTSVIVGETHLRGTATIVGQARERSLSPARSASPPKTRVEYRTYEAGMPAPGPRMPSPPPQHAPLVGLGLRLERNKEGDTYVENIIPGFAAHKDGRIRRDDKIIAVDYQPVENMRLDDVKTLTMGRDGSTCTLQMYRGNDRYQVGLGGIMPPTLDPMASLFSDAERPSVAFRPSLLLERVPLTVFLSTRLRSTGSGLRASTVKITRRRRQLRGTRSQPSVSAAKAHACMCMLLQTWHDALSRKSSAACRHCWQPCQSGFMNCWRYPVPVPLTRLSSTSPDPAASRYSVRAGSYA